MKSDTKRVIITVVLCMAILTVYTKFFAPVPPPAAPPAPAVTTTLDGGVPAQADGGLAAAPATDKPATPGAAPAAAAQKVPERKDVLETPEIRAVLSNHGAGLESYLLKEKQFEQPDGKGGKQALDLVTTSGDERPGRVSFPKNKLEIPDRLEFQVVSATPKDVLYVWEGPKARIEKRVSLGDAKFSLNVEVKVQNKDSQAQALPLSFDLYGRSGGASASGGFMKPPPNIRAAICHAEGKLHEAPPEKLAAPVAFAADVKWAGIGDRYFLMAAIPTTTAPLRNCRGSLEGPARDALVASVDDELKLDAGNSYQARYVLFGGPKFVSVLDAVKPDGRDPALGDAVNYGWLGPISRALLVLMLFFERVFGNWGVAIIMLTIVVKLITLWPTQKSMRSMKEMARLKPEIEGLKKKYGEDKQRLNTEMMQLYKQRGINPLGGCLPMVIQMPVWFALYSTLGNAVELYHSHFLWLKDLTQPDPYFIIPVVMGACMFIQQKTAPQPADSEQQKILMYAMPVMFTFFSLWFPAGLTVYILTNTLLTMAHQYYMNRNDPRRKPARA